MKITEYYDILINFVIISNRKAVYYWQDTEVKSYY